MTVRFDKTFDRELDKLKDKRLKSSIAEAIENIEEAKSILEVRNLKKLKGFAHCYRIRIGDYRIGIYYREKEIELIRFGHRKDFYRYFP